MSLRWSIGIRGLVMIYNANRSGSASSPAEDRPARMTDVRSGRVREHETANEDRTIAPIRTARIKIVDGRAVVVRETAQGED